MFSFRLPLGGFADYAWGSLIVRFGQYTYLTTQTLPEFLAGFMVGRCNWKSAAEFRTHACLVHEMVHYLQDVNTGVGHWDYLVDRDLRTEWNTLSHDSTYLGRDHNHVRTRLKDLNDESRRRAIFVPTALLPKDRKRKLYSDASAVAGIKLDKVHVEPLLIENLLEGEAAANTYLHLEQLKGSKEQLEIAESNGAAFQPWLLPPLYLETLRLFYTMSDRMLTGTETGKDTYAALRVACGMLRVFVDLALAHPSPDLLARTGATREEYEPGLRLIRLIRAFNRVPDEENQHLVHAIVRCHPKDLDRLVTPYCGFPYASYEEIYSDWRRIFEKEAASGRADAAIRRDTCAIRLSDPESAGYKTPSALIEMRIPLMIFTGRGLVNYVTGVHAVEPELRFRLHQELMGRIRDAGMAAYFLENVPFVCPLAESNVCESRTEVCRSGIRQDQQFPSAAKCEVRASLEEVGFCLKR